MAVNFYDQPAQSNLINTYVQAPFQEILQAGLARQGRYDETLASLDANQEYLDQLQAIPGVHTETLNKARTDIQSIASGYANKDLSNAYVRRSLRDEIRRKINPATISNIIQSKKNYDEAQKLKTELSMHGMYFDPYDKMMDPARNGSLKSGELYQYTPIAFQDPEKVADAYFMNVAPDKKVYTDPNTGMITEVTSRSLDRLREVSKNQWRTFADTPQGQWVVNQYKARHQGEHLPNDEVIVQNYLNDVAKRWEINPQQDYVGFDPDAKAATSLRNKMSLLGAMNPVSVPGKAEARPEQEVNYKKNKQEIASLSFKLEEQKSKLRSASTTEAKEAVQAKVDDISNRIARLQDAQKEAYGKAGISTDISDPQRIQVENDIINRYNLTPGEGMVAVEAAENLLSTTKRERGYERVMDYLDEHYPNMDDSSRRKIATAAFGAGDFKSAYGQLNSFTPSRREKKQAFKDVAHDIDHPGYVAPVTRVTGEVDYLYNPRTGKYDMPSNGSTVLKGIQNNPESFALSIYNDKEKKWETINSRDDIKEFNAGKFLKYEILPVLPNERGAQQLEFRLTDKDNKVSEKLYRVDLNDPSQLEALSQDYINSAQSPLDPNFMIGVRLQNPQIASAYMTQKKGSKKLIPISTKEGVAEVTVDMNDDGTQSIYDTNGKPYTNANGTTKFDTDEDVVNALYELQIRFSDLFAE